MYMLNNFRWLASHCLKEGSMHVRAELHVITTNRMEPVSVVTSSFTCERSSDNELKTQTKYLGYIMNSRAMHSHVPGLLAMYMLYMYVFS